MSINLKIDVKHVLQRHLQGARTPKCDVTFGNMNVTVFGRRES